MQVTGKYSFVDKLGREVSVTYDADHKGFRARSDALPQVGVGWGMPRLNGHGTQNSEGNTIKPHFERLRTVTKEGN